MKKVSKIIMMLLAITLILPSMATVVSANEIDGLTYIERLGGKDRDETAIIISQAGYLNGAENVVLVGRNDKVDAVNATLIAAALNAPVLFTHKNILTPKTAKEISRLGAKNIYLVGSTEIISDTLKNKLKDNFEVVRISGLDRYDTAKQGALFVADLKPITHAFIVKGSTNKNDIMAGTLLIAPVAARDNSIVLLTEVEALSQASKDVLTSLNIKEVTIIGGRAAVSENVVKTLKTMEIKVDRVSGCNRYDTAVNIAERYFEDAKTAVLANGSKTTSSLIGGYFSKLNNAPILLTYNNKDTLAKETKDYLSLDLDKTFIVGGQATISHKTAGLIAKEVLVQKIKNLELLNDTKLDKNYREIKVLGKNTTLDLNGNTVKTITVLANKVHIKNGTVTNLNISENVENILLEDIIDTGCGQHKFEGGGQQSIVLKGYTMLNGIIYITSKTPINLRAEDLAAEVGFTGKVVIDTPAKIIVSSDVKEIEVISENHEININAVVEKITFRADTDIIINKDVKQPKLEKAKYVKVGVKTSDGKDILDIETNDKLESTKKEEQLPPRNVKLETVKISGYAVVGQTLTAVTNTNASGVTYQWLSKKDESSQFKLIDKQTSGKFTITSDLSGQTIKVIANGLNSTSASATTEPVITVDDAEKPHSIEIVGLSTIAIPGGSRSRTSNYIATVKNKFDEYMKEESVTWGLVEDSAGVSIDSSTGIVSVTSSAVVGATKIKTTVDSKNTLSNEIQIQLVDVVDPLQNSLYFENEEFMLTLKGLEANKKVNIGMSIKTSKSADVWIDNKTVINGMTSIGQNKYFIGTTSSNGELIINGKIKENLPAGELYITLSEYGYTPNNPIKLQGGVDSDFKNYVIVGPKTTVLSGQKSYFDNIYDAIENTAKGEMILEFDTGYDWFYPHDSNWKQNGNDNSGKIKFRYKYWENPDKEYIIIPEKIGENKVETYADMFSRGFKDKDYDQNSINGVMNITSNNISRVNQMFMRTKSQGLDLSKLSTVGISSFEKMFYLFNDQEYGLFVNGTQFTGIPKSQPVFLKGLENFDTSCVEIMSSMFFRANIHEADISGFDTSKVIVMNHMFSTTKLTTLDLSNFNTSKVTNMDCMFQRSEELVYLNVSGFDTSQVTNMNGMFINVPAAVLDVSNFDTSKVTIMNHMFEGTKAKVLDVSGFDTKNVEKIGQMFCDSSVEELNLMSFNTSNVIWFYRMFAYSKVVELDLSSFDTSSTAEINLGNDMMFEHSLATKGYAKTQEDADRLNSSTAKPKNLIFAIKSAGDLEN